MLLTRTSTTVVSSTEGPIFILSGPNSGGFTLFLENLDTTNYISYRVQTAETNMDSAYSDLASDSPQIGIFGNFATTGILTPSAGLLSNQIMISVRTSASYLRILASASGSAQLNYGIVAMLPATSMNFTTGTL